MKKSKAGVFVAILVVLTGFAALLHLTTRDKVADGEIQLVYREETYSLKYQELKFEQISGTRVNGKGEEKRVEAQGILLKELLDEYNIQEYSQVSIISDDSYRGQVFESEVKEEQRVYLILEEEELRLIVFGDANSKRSVSNVVQIVVE